MKKPLHTLKASGVLTSTALLFGSMTLVNGGNYLFNLVLGRWLGPAAFSDLSLLVTIMLMVTFLTVTFQLTAAKFAAKYSAAGDPARFTALRRWLRLRSWQWGTAIALLLAGGAPLWQRFFQTQSSWPFVFLGLGLPVYFAQGVDRGLLQGESRFTRLALSYQAEMWVRLGVGLGLVAIGGAVGGAVLAISISFVATALVVRRPRGRATDVLRRTETLSITRFALPVFVVQLGQILINNSDILIVKRFFPAAQAGEYAAVALIGRIVFFATWSVVTVIFPLVAQKQENCEPHRYLLHLGLAAVAGVSGLILLIAWQFPTEIIMLLFGADYLALAPLLWQYALATALYALANVVVTYHLSLGNGAGSYLTVAAGTLQVVALTLFHESMAQVILVQIGLMGSLLALLLLWSAWPAPMVARRPTAPQLH